MQTLKTLRTRFGNNFELIRWVTYVFFGGALNAFFIQLYADFVLSGRGPIPPSLIPVEFYLPFFLLIFAPLILSIVLSRAKPEKQPIPPLYITLISIGLFAGFILYRYPSDVFSVLVLYGLLAYFQGVFMNRWARNLLGIAVTTEDFVWAWFTVNGLSVKLFSVLENIKYANTLGFIESDTQDTGEVTVECAARYNYRLQITPMGNELSSVTAIFYDQADWYVYPKDDVLKENAESMVAYLKSVFQKNGFAPSEISWSQTADTDRLVQSTMRKMAGAIPRAFEISRWAWVKIVLLVGVLGYITWLGVVLQDFNTAAGLLVVVILYIVFELRSGTFSGQEDFVPAE